MSIAERYARATRSSDLKIDVEPKDIDVLIAAGWVKEGDIGVSLLRLRGEFDSVKRVRVDGPADRTLMPMLKSFGSTKSVLLAFAHFWAERRRISLTAAEVAETSGMALDAFLDPLCVQCSGLGFTKGEAGYRGPSIRCAACRETGRRTIPWRGQASEDFGRWLGAQMESRVANVLWQMSRFTRSA